MGSAVAAPMIGEIGQSSGSVSNGVGSIYATAFVGYGTLAMALIGCGIAYALPRRRG
jgi:hypothetical protein